ncbi:Glycosyltransferase involved in cell wall bisynthesis [Lachnospiraceae bacterium XBB2008]|nr:Glycosyltransferase involved in cell wall bisynthesis [Lachnospiraceae bacterium XBB2008]
MNIASSCQSNRIKISVIVPVYNVEPYLEQCIRSICDQSYTNLEIVLVDDGSTDGSGAICDDFAKDDPRIIVIHKSNGGIISARKAGAEVATGDYIVGVDSDDWIERDRLLNLVNYALSEYPDMVHMDGAIWEYDDHNEFKMYSDFDYMYEGTDILNGFLRLVVGKGPFMDRKITICHWKSAIRRSIFVDNIRLLNAGITMIEDVIFVFACVLDCRQVVCINEPGYHYRQNSRSVSHRVMKWRPDHARLFYEQFMDILRRHPEAQGESVTDFVTQYTYNNILLTNYRRLYDHYASGLFPYADIELGSRIIVYGAGYVGIEIVNVVAYDDRFSLVAWVDKNPKPSPKSDVEIRDLSAITDEQYDYIIVAILLSSVSSGVVSELESMGIHPDKIRTMQKEYMRYEELDNLTNMRGEGI